MNITFVALQYRWLLAVALPLVIFVEVWAWRRNTTMRDRFLPPAQRIFERPSRVGGAMYLITCDVLAACVLIAGLMHPEREIIIKEPVKEHVATVVAFDISSSMGSEAGYFGEGGRLGAVKRAFEELLLAKYSAENVLHDLSKFIRFWEPVAASRYLMEGHRIGIVAFAGRAMNEMPLTTRQRTLITVIRSLEPVGDPQDDGTNFPAAIEESLLMFEKEDLVKTIILFTDGEEEEGKALPIASELDKAKILGVKIFPIVVGHESAPVPGRENTFTKPDTKLAQHMAEKTGGDWFLFQERDKLYSKLAHIFSNIEAASYESVKKMQNLQPWCAVAFLLLWVSRLMIQFNLRGEKLYP